MDDDDCAVSPVFEVRTHGVYCELVRLQLVFLREGDTEGGREGGGGEGGERVGGGWERE